MILMDTNILSEIRKGQRCDAAVAEWYAGVAEGELYLSVLVLGEIRKGAELARRRRDYAQAEALENWLQTVAERFSERLLPVDAATALTWGRLAALRPLPGIDGLLAATALTYDMTLATRNIADFQGLGVQLLNPFESL